VLDQGGPPERPARFPMTLRHFAAQCPSGSESSSLLGIATATRQGHFGVARGMVSIRQLV